MRYGVAIALRQRVQASGKWRRQVFVEHEAHRNGSKVALCRSAEFKSNGLLDRLARNLIPAGDGVHRAFGANCVS